MRLKSIRIRKTEDSEYEVTPEFYGKLGKTVRATGMREKGAALTEVVNKVLAAVAMLTSKSE